jgi:hypothetical protein
MQESSVRSGLVRAAVIAALSCAVPFVARAQQTAAAAAHPKVCAEGVREYYSKADLPTPYDTLVMPSSEPVRVTSPEELEAAQRLMRAQAGSVGATGLLVLEQRTDDGMGNVEMHRSVTPVFAASDSARANAACRGKEVLREKLSSQSFDPAREHLKISPYAPMIGARHADDIAARDP